MEITKEYILSTIENAKKGKQGAFSFLLHHYWNQVFGFQLKRVNNEYEAEDITIETFSKAFDKLDTYNPSYTFGTWLITISKNIQIDKHRKKNTSVFSKTADTSEEHIKKIPDLAPTAEDKLINEQNLAELLRYIKQLKPHYQNVINLRYFQEMSYNEISESLEEPLNNIKVRLLRARKLLSEIIKSNSLQ